MFSLPPIPNSVLLPSVLMGLQTIASAPIFSTTFSLQENVILNGSAPSQLSGNSPTWMRLTMVYSTIGAGEPMTYLNDEIDACFVFYFGISLMPLFSCGFDSASNMVKVSYNGAQGGQGQQDVFMIWKGAYSQPQFMNNYSLKLYWQ